MEIDLAAVGRLEETVTLLREDAGNAALGSQLVRLNISPELSEMILDATPGRIECISDRDRQIVGRLPVHGNVGAWNAEIDPYVERTSLTMMVKRCFDHDVASGEPWVIELEVVDVFADLRLHCRSQLKIT